MFYPMNLNTQKIELIRMMLRIENEDLIRKIKALVVEEASDWWDELPENVKSNVFKAEKEVYSAQGVSHEEAQKKYAHWLNR